MTDWQDRVDSLLAEAEALLRVKRFQAAAERAKEAVSLAPNDPRPLCLWSRALYGAGQFSEAAQKAEDAIRSAPQDPSAFRLRSNALSTLAREGPRSDRSRIGHERSHRLERQFNCLPRTQMRISLSLRRFP